MALFGSIALIALVLLVVLHRSKSGHPSDYTCSNDTLLFALVLAFRAKDCPGKDILGAYCRVRSRVECVCWHASGYTLNLVFDIGGRSKFCTSSGLEVESAPNRIRRSA